MLLEIASTGAYRPLWSSEILAELDRTLRLLLAKRGTPAEETDAYLTRLFRQMRITFPAAHWTWTAATYAAGPSTCPCSPPDAQIADSVAFGPDGKTLAVSDEGGRIYLWDITAH